MDLNQEEVFKRMQIKVLYSFNNNSTVFLSRSKIQYSVKIAQIPLIQNHETQEEEMVTLGAFDLKSCAHQILKSSPENFKLHSEDYAVYYKDITEQPEEPFVSNGVMSGLLNSTKPHLIPGRVCQNLSASYLFGDKANVSPLTLEIRLKLHTIEKTHEVVQETTQNESMKRPAEPASFVQKKMKTKPSSSNAAVKATRTKSLPIFYNPHNQQIFNIMNADKSNAPSKYDSKSVQDRFKSAPFLQAKIVDNPSKRRSTAEPQRAIRTRSMVQAPIMISSPINEEMSDATDDTEYRETNPPIEEEDDENDDDERKYKNHNQYVPQSHSYKSDNIFQSLPDLEDLDSKKTYTIPHTKLPKDHGLLCTNSNCATTYSINWRYFETGFHPNHLAIHRAKEFDKKHYEGMFGPLCNACYLFLRNKGFMRPEGVVKKYLQQQKYKELKQKETNSFSTYSVDKSYNIQSYENVNHNISRVDDNRRQFSSSPNHNFLTPLQPPSLMNKVLRNGTFTKVNNNNNNNNNNNSNNNNNNNRNNHYNSQRPSSTKSTPNCTDLNDFMNQLNNFGGPLTDIDPLPQDQQGISPPMVATKSNTRVINLYDDGEDKENCPPRNNEESPSKSDMIAFEKMMVKSFNQDVGKSSPLSNNEWINDLFCGQTPKDMVTPKDSKTPKDGKTPSDSKSNDDETESEKDENNLPYSNLPQLKTFTTSRQPSNFQLVNKKATVVNMPSSPLITTHRGADSYQDILSSDPNDSQTFIDNSLDHLADAKNINPQSSPELPKASRLDTTASMMSWQNVKKDFSNSTPNTDFYSNDDILEEFNKGKIERESHIEKSHNRS